MWLDEAIIYQIYPLGFTGAPIYNDGVTVSRILKVIDYIPHLKNLGINCVYFSPIFESDKHGYDTRDYRKIDSRLGSNEDFKKVSKMLHDNGIKVILDGVFNHVGRGFFGFKDVQEKKWDSMYKDWFNISFDGNSNYNDGFWYDNWEGHQELVKLNLNNDNVVNYLFESIKLWVDEFDIDGLRLDVAYCLNRDFLKKLNTFSKSLKNDFALMGEVLFGDYNLLVNDDMLYSCTNYENYKSLYSAINSKNLFEISYSLNRQFGIDLWCIYKNKHLVTFVDNHDVTRISTILNDKNNIKNAFLMLFTMPGVPCIYYASEWGIEGDKKDGDESLRPCIIKPEFNNLTQFISCLIQIRKNERVLSYGFYKNIKEGNTSLCFKREFNGERIYVALNIDSKPVKIDLNGLNIKAKNLINNNIEEILGCIDLEQYEFKILKEI